MHIQQTNASCRAEGLKQGRLSRFLSSLNTEHPSTPLRAGRTLNTLSLLALLLAALAPRAEAVSATGGTVTNYTVGGTNWTQHIFTTVGTTNLNVTIGGNVEVLVVAGGGGGGLNGGGGGAGGLVYSNGFSVVAGTYTVIVGGGGGINGGSGTNSVFSNSVSSAIVAVGGGGGAGLGDVGLNGGSGGGGGGVLAVPTKSGGTNTVGQGNMGGSGGVLVNNWGGCGGGGGAGAAGSPGSNTSNGGNGGNGLYISSFTGVVAATVGTTNDGWFAGGGGGAEINGTIAGTGGRGGGGKANVNTNGTAGATNTGGGGGGGCWKSPVAGTGGAGGSGIVVVRYVTPPPDYLILTNLGVTSATTTSATFNGTLISTGGSACAVCVLWGEQDGGQTWNWARTNWFNDGAVNTAWTNNTPFSTNITAADGLQANKDYFYTFAATNATTNAVAASSKYLITGEVTVQPTVNPAQYYPPTNGVYTILRPATCTGGAVTVNFTMSGTATQGTHYTLSPSGSATINAGDTSTVVTLSVLAGGVGDATLTLTPSPANTYPIGTSSNATVTIAASTLTWYWKGVTTAWSTMSNWTNSLGANPSSILPTDAIWIDTPAGSNNPSLDLSGGAVTVASLTLGSNTSSTLTFTNSLVTDVNKRLRVTGDVTIGANGTLTHVAEWATGAGGSAQAEKSQLYLDVGGDLTIAAGGQIYVSACGYGGGSGNTQGYGPGASTADGSSAGHGGEGGQQSANSSGSTYDSVTDPVRSGSGTGYNIRGGGAAKLAVSGTLTLNGSILSDGSSGGWMTGSGGSINILAGQLAGNGMVSACGTNVSGQMSGGGGGRVAIVLTNADDSAFNSLTLRVWGGQVSGRAELQQGGAGTLYLKATNSPAGYGRLIVDNNNSAAITRKTLINADLTVGDVVLRNQGRLSYDATTRKVTVYGSWSNGVANADSAAATVTFASPATATVWGDNNWYSLTITNAGKAVSFQAGKTQTINASGTVLFDNLVTLKSTTDGGLSADRWILTKGSTGATQNVGRVYVRDSNASAGNTFKAAGGQSLGNNLNWIFPPGGTVFLFR